MSFTVTFYTCTANPKKLDKSADLVAIGTAKTLHGKHEVDMLNPNFAVDYNSTLLSANYCYIAEFGRYYFITVSTDTAQRLYVHGTVDVLYSHATSIKNCDATVIRSESAGVTYVPDNKLPIDPNRIRTEGLPFPKSLRYDGDGHHYILVLNKGGGN